MDPLHSMLGEETRSRSAPRSPRGALSPGVMAATDCKGDYAAPAPAGVEFTMEPAERPYGTEAILRDDSGNWYSFSQRSA